MGWSRWHAKGDERERQDLWQDLLRREMVEVQLKLPNPGKFRCVLDQMQLGGSRLIRFTSTPHTVTRDRVSGNSQLDGQHYMVSAQLAGVTRVRSGELSIELRPGDIGLLDTARPFVNEFAGNITRAVVLIEKSSFSLAPEGMPLGRVPHSCPYFGVMRQHILSLANPSVDHNRDVADALMRGLAVLLGDLPGQVANRPGPQARRVSKEQIDAHLYASVLNADVTPLTIAAEFGVSVRTVFAIYEQANQSLEQTLINARLRRASELLTADEFAHLSVTDISTMVGFRDTSHFSRRFRSEYGKPPSVWRQVRR